MATLSLLMVRSSWYFSKDSLSRTGTAVSDIEPFEAASFEADVPAAPFSGAGVDEEGAAAALSDAPAEEGSAVSVVGTIAATEADDDASTADGASEEDAMTSDDGCGGGAGRVKVDVEIDANLSKGENKAVATRRRAVKSGKQNVSKIKKA